MQINIKVFKCLLCGDEIYSRAEHDMRWCSCGNLAIDGGLIFTETQENYNYTKISFVMPAYTQKIITVESVSQWRFKDDMFRDWNTKRDEFGLIKDLEYKEKLGIAIAKVKLLES